MDSSTSIGLLSGLVILAAALVLGNVPVATLLNPESILIVFGGTLAATLVSFSMNTIRQAVGSLRRISRESRMRPQEMADYVMDVVGFVRDEGVLALQPLLDSVEFPFFKKGLSLVLDNRSEKFIRDSLSTEIEVGYRETMDYAKVFETAGGYSPTMGIIGAVIGLIYVVQSFQDPAQLGQGVAAAFSATLYGVALSNLFLLPLAAKLRQRAREEWFIRTMLLEAILSIRAGEHPMIIEERLNSFLADSSREEKPQLKPYGSSGRASAARTRQAAHDGLLPAGLLE